MKKFFALIIILNSLLWFGLSSVAKADEKKREKLHMFNDYGQQYDRQSMRKDFNPAMTKSKVYSYNGRKTH